MLNTVAAMVVAFVNIKESGERSGGGGESVLGCLLNREHKTKNSPFGMLCITTYLVYIFPPGTVEDRSVL